jgi:hypothetical protein
MANTECIVIHMQGIVYTTPPVPQISKIKKSSKKPEDQVWFRDTSYLAWEWEDGWMNRAGTEQLKWFEEEIYRIHHGCWVMINGVPTWFNKYCYFFHQWFVLQEGYYPIYKDTSLEYFCFYEDCEEDPVYVGEIGIKGRRVGLSSMSASIKLLIALLESNTISGIVSKTGEDAKEMYLFVKNGLENLPKFLIPQVKKATESEIHIANPGNVFDKKNEKKDFNKGKNNRVDYRDTSENAYDQSRKRHMTVDEAAKWIKVNVIIFISKVLETLYVGTSLVGHMSVFSSVNKGDKGGDNFRILWDGSDHVDGKKDSLGRNKTRLKRFFLAGFRGLLGYIGKYGESIIDTPTPEQTAFLKTFRDPGTGKIACPNPYIGAREYLEENRRMLENDPEEYAEQVRKYPFTWKEVFRGANNTCNFNLEELNDQIERVESELEGTGKKEYGRRMTFKMDANGKKYPVDDKQGMWYIDTLIEDNNKSVYKGSIKCPDNVAFGAAGMDTYANSRTSVEDGSDACLIVMSRFSYLDVENSYRPVAMFLGKPDTKGEFHLQIQYGLEYYGVKMLAERSPTDWEDYFTSENIRLASPLDHVKKYGYLIETKRWDGSSVYGIPSQQSKNAIEQHLTVMKEYALNNMKKIKYLRLLRDMVHFDIDDRTKYDACMAFGYSLMALLETVKSSTPPKENKLQILPFQKQKQPLKFKRSA